MSYILKTIACIFIFGSAGQLHAQTDTLVTLNGKRVPVIITEITVKEVIYKIPNKPDLPLFRFKRNNLSDIVFKDGSIINPMFNTVNPFEKVVYPKAKTIFSFTPTQLFQNRLGFAYEYIFRKNFIGIRIPASISYIDVTKFKSQGLFLWKHDVTRTFTTGIDLNVYPVKLGKFKYVVGLGLQYAHFAYQSYNRYGSYPNNTVNYGNHFSFVINNGFISQLTKHFVVSGTVGIGLQLEDAYDSGDPELRLNTTVNVGYMF